MFFRSNDKVIPFHLILRIWRCTFSNKEPSSISLLCSIENIHSRTIRHLSWSPNGQLLAQASFDGTVSIIRLTDLSSRSLPVSYSLVTKLEGHENEVKASEWSPNGKWLATCGRDKTVWIWSYSDEDEDFECYAIKQEHSQDVKCLRWHPADSSILLSGSYDGTVRVWCHDVESDEWESVQTINAFFGGQPSDGKLPGTVWSIEFILKKLSNGTSQEAFVCVGDDGRFQEYQLDESTQRWKIAYESCEELCFGSIFSISTCQNTLALGCSDGSLLILSQNSLEDYPSKEFSSESSNEPKRSDWNISRRIYFATNSDINCVDWLFNGKAVVVCTDDSYVHIVLLTEDKY